GRRWGKAMPDIDIAADTDLGQRAIGLIDDYLRKYPPEEYRREGSQHLTERDWPVSTAQINGLRRIVSAEPGKIKAFADKQSEKDKKALLEIERELNEVKRKQGRRGDEEKLLQQKQQLERRKKLVQGRIEFWTEVNKSVDTMRRAKADAPRS